MNFFLFHSKSTPSQGAGIKFRTTFIFIHSFTVFYILLKIFYHEFFPFFQYRKYLLVQVSFSCHDFLLHPIQSPLFCCFSSFRPSYGRKNTLKSSFEILSANFFFVSSSISARDRNLSQDSKRLQYEQF